VSDQAKELAKWARNCALIVEPIASSKFNAIANEIERLEAALEANIQRGDAYKLRMELLDKRVAELILERDELRERLLPGWLERERTELSRVLADKVRGE
jgi:hypothetical protein